MPDFRLEKHFARWEFAARYNLAGSDAESLSLHELLALADSDGRARWESLRLSYTETFGLPALREAIAGTYERVQPEDVLCFAGAEEGIYLAMLALLGRGDHAVTVTPNYQAAETVPLAACEVTGVALNADDGWQLDLRAVERALRPNTRLISVNFPNNPTGAMPGDATWQQLIELCEERGIRLFSDEVYRGLERAPRKALAQAADLSGTALSLNVMSKAYGLPGLRIGWIACRDREVLAKLERAKHYTTICNAGPSEVLALIALRARETILERNRSYVVENIELYRSFFARNRELFAFDPPQGGCVCFPAYLGDDGVEAMCERLVSEHGLLLLPASLFVSDLTPTPKNRFRIGLGRNPRMVAEALTIWENAL